MDRKEILSQLTPRQISEEEADPPLRPMESRPRGTPYCKVSPKGAISGYGLQPIAVQVTVLRRQRLADIIHGVPHGQREPPEDLLRAVFLQLAQRLDAEELEHLPGVKVLSEQPIELLVGGHLGPAERFFGGRFGR